MAGNRGVKAETREFTQSLHASRPWRGGRNGGGWRQVARRLPELEAGSAPRRPQDESAATCFGRRRPEDGKIDWSKSAEEIYNLIRAVTHPFPGAFTELAGKKYYIWKARPIEGGAKPHTIVSENPPVIGTGDGLLEILRLQPEGGEEGETFQ